MSRDNATWIADIGGGESRQQTALADLRSILMHSLRRALAQWGPADEAFLEDVMQETLVRILEKLGQFEGRSRFVTWATAIAIRVAMSELRRRRWRDVSLNDVVADAAFVPERAAGAREGPETCRTRAKLLAAMHRVIGSELTEKQRTVLLAELKGMPQDDIARHLGSNRNAVYKLTHDARRRLRKGLEAAGYGVEDIGAAFPG